MTVEIRAWTQDSPIGPLLVATTPVGVCLVDWAMTAVSRVRLEASGDVVDEVEPVVSAAFDEYFGGSTAALNDLAVDLRFARGDFVLLVLRSLRRLPAGTTTSYGELAAAVGRHGAAQAVGQAVGSNPVPIIVPCHRVVSADGSLGGFSGGLDKKRFLLAHEGFAALPGGWAVAGDAARRDGQMTLEF